MSVLVVRLRQGEISNASTRRTNTARFTVSEVDADQRTAQFDRELPLSDAFVTSEQQRIGHTAFRDQVMQRFFYVIVSDEIFEHPENQINTLPTIETTSLWISSIEPEASTIWNLSGSRSAMPR